MLVSEPFYRVIMRALISRELFKTVWESCSIHYNFQVLLLLVRYFPSSPLWVRSFSAGSYKVRLRIRALCHIAVGSTHRCRVTARGNSICCPFTYDKYFGLHRWFAMCLFRVVFYVLMVVPIFDLMHRQLSNTPQLMILVEFYLGKC